MPKTIVGLFPSASEAQKAKHELVDQGYSASRIQVTANDAAPAGTPAMHGGTLASNETADETSWGAKISHFFHSLTGGDDDDTKYYTEGVQKGGAVLSVTVDDGQEQKATDLLGQYGANVERQGAANVPLASTASASTGAGLEYSGDAAIPIVEEELQVGKRQVERGGVRVYSHMVEKPVEEDIQLREEHVRVDRQSVNRPATEADFTAFKEGAMELTETSEEAVVSKSARVVEEIVLGKESSERTETIRDTVRHTEVEVEQLGTKDGAPVADYDRARQSK